MCCGSRAGDPKGGAVEQGGQQGGRLGGGGGAVSGRGHPPRQLLLGQEQRAHGLGEPQVRKGMKALSVEEQPDGAGGGKYRKEERNV